MVQQTYSSLTINVQTCMMLVLEELPMSKHLYKQALQYSPEY